MTERKCLICSAPIAECRLGVDSCRACALFFKRIRSSTQSTPRECIKGHGKCVEKGTVISCRKCRFDRFSEVLDNAKENNDDNNDEFCKSKFVNAPSFEPAEEYDQTPFIDHNTFRLVQLSDYSSTPLLDRIRWSYSLMCQTLKSGETGTKPASFHLSHSDLEGTNIRFVPATCSMIIRNARIFLSALHDFAKMAFPDFAQMETESKGLCVSGCHHAVSLLVAAYRAEHYFPSDLDRHFASYTTIIHDESIQYFLDDCPSVTNNPEAIASMKRANSMSRQFFHRIKPDNVEFTALLGLAFWNNGASDYNEELFVAVQRNRAQILKEMHVLYSNRRKIDYAARLGELFCLLNNVQESATLSMQDSKMYRLSNLVNEEPEMPSDPSPE